MYGNGAGTGKQMITIAKQKVAAIQRVPRRVLTASSAVVVGTTALAARLFLAAAAATPATATLILVSGWCVPVLNKTTCCVKEQP